MRRREGRGNQQQPTERHQPRRKWDTAAEINPAIDLATLQMNTGSNNFSSSGDHAAGPSPTTKKQLEYIRMLEERNRLKSQIQEKMEKKTQKLKEREKAFTTTFNGANQNKKRGMTAATSTHSKGPGHVISSSKTTSSHRSTKERNIRSAPIAAKRHTQLNSNTTTSARKQWSKGQDIQFAVDARGKLQPRVVLPEVQVLDSDEVEEEEDTYLDESFEEFEDDFEAESSRSDSGYSTTSGVEDYEETEVSMDSSALKFMKSTCPSDVESLRQSLNILGQGSPVQSKSKARTSSAMSKKNNNSSATISRRTFIAEDKKSTMSSFPTSHQHSKQDDPGIALSIRDAIAMENQRIKENNGFTSATEKGEAKETQAVVAEDAAYVEHEEEEEDSTNTQMMSTTASGLLKIVEQLSPSKQQTLVNVLEKFADSDKNEHDVHQLQQSFGQNAELWTHVSQALQHQQSVETQARETNSNQHSSAYSQKLQIFEREEEERLMLIERRRKQRLVEIEAEEREHEARLEMRRKERLEQLRQEEEMEEQLAQKRRQRRLEEQHYLESKATSDLNLPADETKEATSETLEEKCINVESSTTSDDDRKTGGDTRPPSGFRPTWLDNESKPSMAEASSSSIQEAPVTIHSRTDEDDPVLSPQESDFSPTKKQSTRRRSSRKSKPETVVEQQQPRPPKSHLQESWDTLDMFQRRINLSRNLGSGLPVAEDSSQELRTSVHFTPGLLDEKHTEARTFVLAEEEEKEETASERLDLVDKFFEIPNLPRGQTLVIDILSTWGDPYYVGLNGIDFFNAQGDMISFSSPQTQISAEPHRDINDLEDYENDPRQVRNVLDGMSYTCDDLHVWLAPYERGQTNRITVTFDTSVRLALMRFWNYNKSRAHSYRGIRDIQMRLDDRLIFEGEIRKAPGMMVPSMMDKCAEVILFTTDEILLQGIEASDAVANCSMGDTTESFVQRALAELRQARPRTSDAEESSSSSSSGIWRERKRAAEEDDDYEDDDTLLQSEALTKCGRPKTAALGSKDEDKWTSPIVSRMTTVDEDQVAESKESSSSFSTMSGASLVEASEASELPIGQHLQLVLTETWGDLSYIGLSGIEVLVGIQGQVFPLSAHQVQATPRDLHSLGYEGDPRTLDKLFDGVNSTMDDTHMWLIPFTSHTPMKIDIDLGHDQLLFGLRVYNYNKSREDTYRGVRRLHVVLDNVLISPQLGYILRKAPGHALFRDKDVGQVLPFAVPGTSTSQAIHEAFDTSSNVRRNYISPQVAQDYETPVHPSGFSFKLVLLSSWGDPYYLGLNGLELYDVQGKILPTPDHITACPSSIRDLEAHYPGSKDDPRVPENLFNRDNTTWDSSVAWLAPTLTTSCDDTSSTTLQVNVVCFAFDRPQTISMIKIWNYSKTPNRGVREIEIWLDDVEIFSGQLHPAPAVAPVRAKTGTKLQQTSDFAQPILFTTNPRIIGNEKRKVVYCGKQDQDVLCINEGQVMTESQAMHRAPDPSAVGVEIDLSKRPMTASIS